MPLSMKEKERQYRVLYEALHVTPRIFKKDIGNLLHVKLSSASKRLKEAFERGWLSKPQVRKRSWANHSEYAYFLKCKNPTEFFSEFVDHKNIIYHALTGGDTNLWVISKEELDFQCDILVKGLRSDYHVSFAPNHSWDKALQNMRKMAEEFDPKEYEPQRIIKTHWDERVEWDSEFEVLFREFNYDLRKPISPIMSEHLISWGKVEKWMKNLSRNCTVFTMYYPGGISSYDPYLFMIKTKYEDFIINLFSELPTSTLFFKVSNRLYVYAHLRREYMRVVDFQIDINRLQIPDMITKLVKKEVIEIENHGIVECYWNNDP